MTKEENDFGLASVVGAQEIADHFIGLDVALNGHEAARLPLGKRATPADVEKHLARLMSAFIDYEKAAEETGDQLFGVLRRRYGSAATTVIAQAYVALQRHEAERLQEDLDDGDLEPVRIDTELLGVVLVRALQPMAASAEEQLEWMERYDPSRHDADALAAQMGKHSYVVDQTADALVSALKASGLGMVELSTLLRYVALQIEDHRVAAAAR